MLILRLINYLIAFEVILDLIFMKLCAEIINKTRCSQAINKEAAHQYTVQHTAAPLRYFAFSASVTEPMARTTSEALSRISAITPPASFASTTP